MFRRTLLSGVLMLRPSISAGQRRHACTVCTWPPPGECIRCAGMPTPPPRSPLACAVRGVTSRAPPPAPSRPRPAPLALRLTSA